MADPAHLSATVHGRVQGVYFRAFVEREARGLGLTGYTRNLPGGISVEVSAEGERENLEALVKSLQVGPSGSRVEKVDIEWGEYSHRFDGFRIRY
ncbi:MAG: acylphosphatase [Dehalococcoidia bacterium]